jgi:hypothetical protein
MIEEEEKSNGSDSIAPVPGTYEKIDISRQRTAASRSASPASIASILASIRSSVSALLSFSERVSGKEPGGTVSTAGGREISFGKYCWSSGTV